jgi:hypothetical protein
MTRKLFATALVGLACSFAAYAEDAKTPAAGKAGKLAGKLGGADRGKLFDLMDANGDGKLSKTEITGYMEKARDRLKASGKGEKLGDKMTGERLDKLDTNADGYVSREEFEKGTTMLGAYAGKGGPKKGPKDE